MKVIKEYLLDKTNVAKQALYITQGADIVYIRDTDIGLMLYCIVNATENKTELRTFKICSVSENIYEDDIKYLGAFQSSVGMRHVIEII